MRHTDRRDTSTPWIEARRLAHRLAVALDAEEVPLAAAAGRTLAAALTARVMVPGFDNAAMDGYAVRGPGPWRLVGGVLAGQSHTFSLSPGEAFDIATGALLPRGADRVVPYEVAERVGDSVCAPPAGKCHIRRAGEYVSAGDTVLPRGAVLTAAALGLAASVGVDTLAVRRRPAVRVLVTGDELIGAGVPTEGLVRDAVGPAITTLVPAWGADLLEVRWVRDQPRAALVGAVQESLNDADITVVCGSSSVGPADGLHACHAEVAATIHIDGVACRPGHPQSLASVGTKWIVGLPGNPFAALVAAHTVLRPLLDGLLGRPLPEQPGAHLVGDPQPDARVTRLVPVRWHDRAVHVIEGDHPGHLAAAAQAAALAVIPPDWHAGDAVSIIPL